MMPKRDHILSPSKPILIGVLTQGESHNPLLHSSDPWEN